MTYSEAFLSFFLTLTKPLLTIIRVIFVSPSMTFGIVRKPKSLLLVVVVYSIS